MGCRCKPVDAEAKTDWWRAALKDQAPQSRQQRQARSYRYRRRNALVDHRSSIPVLRKVSPSSAASMCPVPTHQRVRDVGHLSLGTRRARRRHERRFCHPRMSSPTMWQGTCTTATRSATRPKEGALGVVREPPDPPTSTQAQHDASTDIVRCAPFSTSDGSPTPHRHAGWSRLACRGRIATSDRCEQLPCGRPPRAFRAPRSGNVPHHPSGKLDSV